MANGFISSTTTTTTKHACTDHKCIQSDQDRTCLEEHVSYFLSEPKHFFRDHLPKRQRNKNTSIVAIYFASESRCFLYFVNEIRTCNHDKFVGMSLDRCFHLSSGQSRQINNQIRIQSALSIHSTSKSMPREEKINRFRHDTKCEPLHRFRAVFVDINGIQMCC